MIACDECYRQVATLADLDTISWRGSGEWYQPWDRAHGCDDRHTDSASGSIAPWQHLFSHWYDHFNHDDVARVPGIDAVSLLAADPYKIPSSSARSFGDFFINRRNVHAICLGSFTRRWRVSDARD